MNIAEILKDYPKGTKLYSPLCGECEFYGINNGTIICKDRNNRELTFTSEGYYLLPVFDDAKPLLFPSEENTVWNKFKIPFKDGDIVATMDGNWIGITSGGFPNKFIPTYCVIKSDNTFEAYFDTKETWHFNRLATDAEKVKLFQAIKDNGYHWNIETKTLKKLIEPKFKIGDLIVQNNDTTTPIKITSIDDEYYYYDSGNSHCILPIYDQSNWCLFESKFNSGDIVVITDSSGYSYIVFHNNIRDIDRCYNTTGYNCFCGNLFINSKVCYEINSIRYANENEKQKLLDKIKKNGYYWNAKTKTLEKLVKPKFKVGDRIQNKCINMIGTIALIDNDERDYRVTLEKGGITYILFEFQDEWELVNINIKPKFEFGDCVVHHKYGKGDITQKILIDDEIIYEIHFENFTAYCKANELCKYESIPNKFDISTLKPYESKVLVRNYKTDYWKPSIFRFAGKDKNAPFCVEGGDLFNTRMVYTYMCIPYEGNEHLLGTTNDCDEYYKTW